MEILVILSRVPYPLDKGDKLRAYHQLKILSQKNTISLFCLNEGKINPEAKKELKKLCHRLEIYQFSKMELAINLMKSFRNKLPFQVNYFYSKKVQRKFDKFLENRVPDLIYCQLVRTAEYVKKYQTIPLVIDFMDALSSALSRRAEKSNTLFKPLIKAEAKRLQQFEQNVAEFFHRQTIISHQDYDLLPLKNKSQLRVIPNGVDVEYFENKHGEKNADLLFVGNMSYPPNVDAVCYFVDSIFPHILKSKPNATLLISGTQPTKKVLALANNRITVSGFLPDIRDAYNSCRVFIAPLRLGAGLQNKLLEAMSMEMPFVATSLAFNALQMPYNELLCADDEKKFAENCLKLLENPSLCENYGKQFRTFVSQNYSWDKQAEKLEEIFENIDTQAEIIEA